MDPNIELIGFVYCPELTECNFCEDPTNGIYYRGHDDDWIHICGKCIVENQKRNRGNFNESDLPEQRLPF